jgi:hypothetical protein
MRTITKALFGVGLLAGLATLDFGSAGTANAQGFYVDAPGIHVGVGERHHRRYYREYHRDYGYHRGYGAYAADPGHPYGYRHDYGDPRCGRPNFTIQDGVCKPYTGR